MARPTIQLSTTVATTATTPATATKTATPVPKPQHYKQTQAVQVENFWDVEILSVKTSQGGQYSKPQKAGDVFLVFIVKVKNIASQEETVSSLVQFSLLDSTGQKYTETFFSDAPAALDGKVEPNAVQQGSLVYEVPAGEHRFELHFQVLFVTGQIIWNIEI